MKIIHRLLFPDEIVFISDEIFKCVHDGPKSGNRSRQLQGQLTKIIRGSKRLGNCKKIRKLRIQMGTDIHFVVSTR